MEAKFTYGERERRREREKRRSAGSKRNTKKARNMSREKEIETWLRERKVRTQINIVI